MIYTTGAVSTVSGSAIVKGSGTKFKNNNPAINIGMTILIKSGNTNIPYMIKSVNSDTELVLAHPALATVNNTPFSIHITEPDNNSDAARTMVAINAYTQYFLDAMNTWMSETGQTKIEMPNGETITLDSIKKMQGDISNKITTAIHVITGGVDSAGNGSLSAANGALRVYRKNNGTITIYSRENADNTSPYINEFELPSGVGVGAFRGESPTKNEFNNALKLKVTYDNHAITGGVDYASNGSVNAANGALRVYRQRSGLVTLYSRLNADETSDYIMSQRVPMGAGDLLSTSTTTFDSNGFVKKASPVININPNGTFTTNDESEGATVTRVAKGEYLIEGVLGFNSDAGWGGVDGGIEIPLDVNKQPLIWVNSKINKDGSILVKTYHRTHPNAPKFARNDIDGFNDSDPIDIPAGRFISVRVQMPEQSIYNVRMREMEEAQKAEEERRQKEEEMKAQFGLGENDALL